MTSIRVAVAGVSGKMGQEVAKAVRAAPDMQLVAGLEREQSAPVQLGTFLLPVFNDPDRCMQETTPDVVVDFTHAEAAERTIRTAVSYGVRPVIGTTGLSSAFLADMAQEMKEQGLGGLYAPNFAIGALLMIRAAEMASRYLAHVEIVEYHHEAKKDAPSGTAKKTAERISRARLQAGLAMSPLEHAAALHTVAGIPVHSVRLPGFVAHQEIIFGGDGERLTVRHDSMSRSSFMPGVLLGVRGVMSATGLVDGLEHFLF